MLSVFDYAYELPKSIEEAVDDNLVTRHARQAELDRIAKGYESQISELSAKLAKIKGERRKI